MDIYQDSRCLALEEALYDEGVDPIDLPFMFLKVITNNFSDDRLIGRGGFGEVYKGILQNGMVVAVKKLLDKIDILEANFQSEVACLIEVKHKNIVRCLGYSSETQHVRAPYEGKFVWADLRQRLFCFEYLSNGSLADYLTGASSGLQWSVRYQIIKGICEGVGYLHQHSIIHMDLKPQNILLDDNMVPKIADFGLSRRLSENQSRIVTKRIIGTPGYLAPEFLSSKTITFKADIYSLGVIIIEILMGHKECTSVDKVLESWTDTFRTLGSHPLLGQVKVCAEIGMNCMNDNPRNRPSIQDIICSLDETDVSNFSVRSVTSTSSGGQLVDEVVLALNPCEEQVTMAGSESRSRSRSPCGSCKVLRQQCTQECVFAPYFPAEDPSRHLKDMCTVKQERELEEKMEVALGAANWLLGQVLNKLSDDLVKAYVSSTMLGLNLVKIRNEMLYTKGLLEAAQETDFAGNSGLNGLLEDLSKKADEAEDALDELHYFMIQDKLDGTQEAIPDLGDGLGPKAQHARHSARSIAGNWLSCFSCCRSQDDVAAAAKMSVDHGIHVGKLLFDRVAMSNKIKQLIEELHSNCTPVSDLLKIVSGSNPQQHMPGFAKRPDTSSEITQEKLFGRDAIFEKTIEEIISVTQSGKTLSILPIVGPGGIGKTTFTQHLYNHKRIKEHFIVRAWICVSTNYDVLKLTKEILSCLPATENAGNKTENETTNLDKLQKTVAERLKSKRFLIVLDDIWECSSNDEWEKLLAPFRRDETRGNVILVTTRFPKIVEMVTKEANPIDLRGLDPDEFWKFFQICAFGRIQDEHGDQELIGIAKQIADKLKCSPLAAKTVGRLLIKKPFQEHWMKILDNKEWLEENHDNNIIPALKISYDYLPFHLKKCFSCFSLFPDDYKFEKLEIICFWDSIGIIDCTRKKKKTEDIGSNYLDELVDNGFLMKGDDNFYVMHDLLHDLSRIVSLEECAYISCSSFDANEIPKTVRYLSIFMLNTHIQNFDEDMGKLKERIDIKNLRSLMIFGEYNRLHLINVLKDTFKEINGLRVLSIFMNSYSSLPNNFSKLVHLRYLKLISPFYSKMSLPSIVPRFYHLKFLDLKQWRSGCSLPKDISCLENLRHFVASENFHSNVPEVGKMKFLQELKEFHVKKESVGFELGELGKLEELGGVLNIHGLENVTTRQEAKEAKLMAKRNLVELGLLWNQKHESPGDDILDSIQPHSYIRRLCIVNHGGVVGPGWLCSNNLYMKNLETLHLESVSWANLAPIGQMYHLRKLKLKNIIGLSQIGPDFFGGTTEKSFTHLKEVEFCDMPELVEWVGGANCHLFSRLEKISCTDCPMLTTLLFSGWPISSTEDSTIWFPSLSDLHIDRCPKLCLPPLPHTSMVSYIDTECVFYTHIMLNIWKPCELALHNLGDVERLKAPDASLLSFMDLQKLHSLRHIEVNRCEETFLRGLDDGVVLHTVQSLDLEQFSLTRKSLSNLFKCFPALSHLDVSASSDEDQEEVILQFPPSSLLRNVSFHGCKNLILPVEEGEGAGFYGLSSLESVTISNCDKLFTQWSMGGAADQTQSIIYPLPPCLKELSLWGQQSTLPMALLANLTSLTSLVLVNCKDITVDGFNPLITINLEHLMVYNWRDGEAQPYSVAADVPAAVARTKTMPAGSFQLVRLHVDSISTVLVAPICSRLSATLQKLYFSYDWRTEKFTEEQDEALWLLTSLQQLVFDNCRALQSLPQGLHRLPSLEDLRIWGTQKIRSLPKEGLPDSLRLLDIQNCGPDIYEECQKLRGIRPDIHIVAFLADAES